MTTDTTDQAVRASQYDWPLWEIWVVRRLVGDPLFCARRRGNHHELLHAHNPGHLGEYLEEASAE